MFHISSTDKSLTKNQIFLNSYCSIRVSKYRKFAQVSTVIIDEVTTNLVDIHIFDN